MQMILFIQSPIEKIDLRFPYSLFPSRTLVIDFFVNYLLGSKINLKKKNLIYALENGFNLVQNLTKPKNNNEQKC